MGTLGRFIGPKGRVPLNPSLFSPAISGLDNAEYDLLDNTEMSDAEVVSSAPLDEKQLLKPIDAQEHLRKRGIVAPDTEGLISRREARRKKLLSTASGQGLGMLLGAILGKGTHQKVSDALPTVAALKSLINVNREEEDDDTRSHQLAVNAFYKGMGEVDNMNNAREIANLRYGDDKKAAVDKEIHSYKGADNKQHVIVLKADGTYEDKVFGDVPEKGEDSLSAYQRWRMEQDKSDDLEKRKVKAQEELQRMQVRHKGLIENMVKLDSGGDIDPAVSAALDPKDQAFISSIMAGKKGNQLTPDQKKQIKEVLRNAAMAEERSMNFWQQHGGFEVTPGYISSQQSSGFKFKHDKTVSGKKKGM